MSADPYDAAVGRPVEPGGAARRWWSAVTVAIVAAIFVEAVFAGALLSGAAWARAAHAATAMVLIVTTATAGLICLVTCRIPHGLRLALTLMALAAAVLLQTALGKVSAHGANLLWAHVPLGVALVGFAAHAVAVARRLGEA